MDHAVLRGVTSSDLISFSQHPARQVPLGFGDGQGTRSGPFFLDPPHLVDGGRRYLEEHGALRPKVPTGEGWERDIRGDEQGMSGVRDQC